MPEEKVDATSAKPKSWLTLSTDELRAVVESGVLPEPFTWTNLAEHPNFEALFRYRDNPAKLASALLEEKTGRKKGGQRVQYVPALSPEYRAERLKLKQEELAVQKLRIKTGSLIYDKVGIIETKLRLAIEMLVELQKQQKEMFAVIKESELRLRFLKPGQPSTPTPQHNPPKGGEKK